MYAKSNFKKELWSTIFTSEPSKSQYKQNGSKYVITLCQSVFLGFNNYWVLLHKINFHWRISMSVNTFPLQVFDFGVSLSAILSANALKKKKGKRIDAWCAYVPQKTPTLGRETPILGVKESRSGIDHKNQY